MAGGSEFRSCELANGIARYTDHESFLLVEKKLPIKLVSYIHPKVKVVENCFTQPDYFYNTDSMVVINTDANEFSTLDYWQGKSSRHNYFIDMNKMKGKTICFLYNFIVNPSRFLYQFYEYGINLKIFVTNRKFYDEITKQDRYEDIRIIPRYILESPINPDLVNISVRSPSGKICFGMHSKRLGNKWNDEFYKLVKDVNERYSLIEKNGGKNKKIKFYFMGMKDELRKKMTGMKNVVILKEDEKSVKEFLDKIDVFLFFPDWKREEPWARVIAESMVAGCPVIALNKGGTPDQVLDYNNGILCKNYKDYYKAVVYFVEHMDIIPYMSSNSIRTSKSFYTEKIISKLIEILEN